MSLNQSFISDFSESPNFIPVHFLMLSSHLSFCLPLLLAPFTVPCRIVFVMLEDLEMWPYHLSFRFFTMVRRSSCTGFCCESPRSSHGLCRICSEVSYSISSQGRWSFSRVLLSISSSPRHKGRWIRWASVRISLILDASEMFLSLHMMFSLERAAVVWAILERISDFDPSLEMIVPRYLKFSTASSLWPFTLISLWKPFGSFVITFVLSGPIFILYLVVFVSRRSTRTPASSSSSALTTMSSAKRKLVISWPPLLTLPSW